jgi:hypothetical protein
MDRDQELWTIVMIKYPKIPQERTCLTEKKFRELARESYYSKLLREHQSLQSGTTNNLERDCAPIGGG